MKEKYTKEENLYNNETGETHSNKMQLFIIYISLAIVSASFNRIKIGHCNDSPDDDRKHNAACHNTKQEVL